MREGGRGVFVTSSSTACPTAFGFVAATLFCYAFNLPKLPFAAKAEAEAEAELPQRGQRQLA